MVEHERAVELVLGLPETEEGSTYGNRAWKVGGKLFAWDRPFSKADLRRFGDRPVPSGPIIALRVDDLGEKAAVLEAGTPGLFTIEHFDGHPAILVQLDAVGESELRAALIDAWLAVAPDPLAAAFLAERARGDAGDPPS